MIASNLTPTIGDPAGLCGNLYPFNIGVKSDAIPIPVSPLDLADTISSVQSASIDIPSYFNSNTISNFSSGVMIPLLI